MIISWSALGLFMLTLLFLTLYGLSVSGHFPMEFRGEQVGGGAGAIILWGTILVASAALVMTFLLAWRALPWYAIAIGGGVTLLLGPLMLQSWPDRFVNGRLSLVLFSLSALFATFALWCVG